MAICGGGVIRERECCDFPRGGKRKSKNNVVEAEVEEAVTQDWHYTCRF